MNGTFDSECSNCKVTIERITKWIDHVGCSPRKFKRYDKLLDFVRGLATRSCCNVCDCIFCNALLLLREINESNE